MTRLLRSLSALLALGVLMAGFGLVSPAPAEAQTTQCTTNTYDMADAAKDNFAEDCGQPFQNTPDFRCDWVPGGWQCSGPGTAQSSTPTAPGPNLGDPTAPTDGDRSNVGSIPATGCADGVGGVHDTADQAKASYEDDCGQPFQNTPDFRCDWVPGGWQCSGPGTAQSSTPTPNVPAHSDTELAPPSNVGFYLQNGQGILRWDAVLGAESYDIFRNQEYSETVTGTARMVGNSHAVYTVAAVGSSGSETSERSNFVFAAGGPATETSTLPAPGAPTTILLSRSSHGMTVLAWNSGVLTDLAVTWDVIRDGRLVAQDILEPSFIDVHSEPGVAHNYQVRAQRRSGETGLPSAPISSPSTPSANTTVQTSDGSAANATTVVYTSEELLEAEGIDTVGLFNMGVDISDNTPKDWAQDVILGFFTGALLGDAELADNYEDFNGSLNSLLANHGSPVRVPEPWVGPGDTAISNRPTVALNRQIAAAIVYAEEWYGPLTDAEVVSIVTDILSRYVAEGNSVTGGDSLPEPCNDNDCSEGAGPAITAPYGDTSQCVDNDCWNYGGIIDDDMDNDGIPSNEDMNDFDKDIGRLGSTTDTTTDRECDSCTEETTTTEYNPQTHTEQGKEIPGHR